MTTLSVNIKMYQVGELGDCFLLSFRLGEEESNVLIDCGSFRNGDKSKKRLSAVLKHIKGQLKNGKLDLVIGTHQHNDHVSGFVHCEELFKGAIEQVWLSWLDNPLDKQARLVEKDQQKLLMQLKDIQQAIAAQNFKKDMAPINDILGFYAAGPDGPLIGSQGIANLKKLGTQDPEYLSPGEIKTLPGMSAEAVKVYVMGPPRNQQQLFDKDPGKEETYDHSMRAISQQATRMLTALSNRTDEVAREELQFPFNRAYCKAEAITDKDILKRYHLPAEAWKKIDTDWLDQANQLALYLDSYTNNSSLVLAFELGKSKKVLLFAADAQAGNWLSWEELQFKEAKKGFKAYDLLERTVLYKVGHHGSHNATLVRALEAMEHEELVAMISVDKTDPNIQKPNGWKMPARNLYKRLKEKTKHRVLLMDDGFAEHCNPAGKDYKGSWEKLSGKPKINKKDGCIEYTVFDK